MLNDSNYKTVSNADFANAYVIRPKDREHKICWVKAHFVRSNQINHQMNYLYSLPIENYLESWIWNWFPIHVAFIKPNGTMFPFIDSNQLDNEISKYQNVW